MTNHKGRPKGVPQRQHEPTPEEIITARHMHHAGATAEEIQNALGWACNLKTVVKRLSRFGLKVRINNGRRAHMGDETYLNWRPNHHAKNSTDGP
jgi:hypothetical protein